jgi:hypothetical protein
MTCRKPTLPPFSPCHAVCVEDQRLPLRAKHRTMSALHCHMLHCHKMMSAVQGDKAGG